jgi:hypothetical protein
MSNVSSIQAQIWKGYARAASKLGMPFNFYRPQAGHIQLEGGSNLQLEGGGDLSLEGGVQFPGSPLFVRCVSLNAEDMNYRKPSKYAKATWYAVMDGTGLKVGDYFIGQGSSGDMQLEGGGNLLLEDGTNLLVDGSGDTYFIAAMQPLLPIFVVECNRVVSLYKPQSQSGVGQQGYTLQLHEISSEQDAHFDSKVFIAPSDQAAKDRLTQLPVFVPAAELDKAKQEAATAKAAEAAELKAEETKAEQYRSQYPGNLHFDYTWDQSKGKALGLQQIWRDDKFTYLRGQFQETPALYEVKDKKGSLINFDFNAGLYTVPKQLDSWASSLSKAF